MMFFIISQNSEFGNQITYNNKSKMKRVPPMSILVHGKINAIRYVTIIFSWKYVIGYHTTTYLKKNDVRGSYISDDSHFMILVKV